MDYTFMILVIVCILCWRMRHDNEKQQEILERIAAGMAAPTKPTATTKRKTIVKPRRKIIIRKRATA